LKNDNATLVVGSANFFTAPVGTAMPASLADVPPSPWENVGHTSLEDIFSASSDGGDATTLGTLQNKALRTTYSPRTESFAVTVQQFDRKSLRLYYGANAPLLANGTLGVPSNPGPDAEGVPDHLRRWREPLRVVRPEGRDLPRR
jgi:hypothetical protein